MDKEEFSEALGAHIRKTRKELGISGAELCRRCDLEEPNLHKLETGKFTPTVWHLIRICDGLGITLLNFLNEFGPLEKGTNFFKTHE